MPQIFVILLFAGAFGFLFFIKVLLEKASGEDRSGKRTRTEKPSSVGRNTPQCQEAGLSYRTPPKVSFAWAWMQCAGKFGYTYLRQDDTNPYPAIRGKEGDCTIQVRAVPASCGRKGYDTLLRAEFPKSAGLGLYLAGGEELCQYEGTHLLDARHYFEDARASRLVLAVENEELFREYYYTPCGTFLQTRACVYQGFVLTDHFFEVCLAGAENNVQKMEEALDNFVDACQFFTVLSDLTNQKMSDRSFRSSPGESQQIPSAEIKPPAPASAAQTMPQTLAEQIKQSPAQPEYKAPEQEIVVNEGVTQVDQSVLTQKQSEMATCTAENTPHNPDPLAKETLVNTLWSKTFPGSEERELFEKTYKGQKVCWEGTLRSSYEYSYDFVFGQSKGIKATVDLAEIRQQNSSFKIMIRAVISFPPEEKERLKSANGKKICFQGSLLKYEALSRELYLSEGTVLSTAEV